jgi:hypothetical protein
MSLHLDTLFWFRANQSLLFLLNAACLAEKQQIPILKSLAWPDLGSNPRSTAVEASTLTITTPMRKTLHQRWTSAQCTPKSKVFMTTILLFISNFSFNINWKKQYAHISGERAPCLKSWPTLKQYSFNINGKKPSMHTFQEKKPHVKIMSNFKTIEYMFQ